MEQLATGRSKHWKYQLVQEHAGQILDEQPFKIRSHNTIERFEEAHSLPVNLYFLITVNDRLSAAALIKVFRFLGAALIRLRRLFDCGAYFKDC